MMIWRKCGGLSSRAISDRPWTSALLLMLCAIHMDRLRARILSELSHESLEVRQRGQAVIPVCRIADQTRVRRPAVQSRRTLKFQIHRQLRRSIHRVVERRVVAVDEEEDLLLGPAIDGLPQRCPEFVFARQLPHLDHEGADRGFSNQSVVFSGPVGGPLDFTGSMDQAGMLTSHQP